jgi:hypothetical protein
VTRFPDKAHFASWNGTARSMPPPVTRSGTGPPPTTLASKASPFPWPFPAASPRHCALPARTKPVEHAGRGMRVRSGEVAMGRGNGWLPLRQSV